MIKKFIGATLASLLSAIPTTVLAISYPVIMNEYNSISSGKYIDGNDYVDSSKGDAYFASFTGMPDGRVQGNGGNWFELVVTGQNVDMRGWGFVGSKKVLKMAMGPTCGMAMGPSITGF